ncbi:MULTISPECIES: hypothetical protein [unclassified Streptosporangium]
MEIRVTNEIHDWIRALDERSRLFESAVFAAFLGAVKTGRL